MNVNSPRSPLRKLCVCQQNITCQYVEAMESLLKVVQELSLVHDLNTIMDLVQGAARQLTGADGASFVLREEDHCFYAAEQTIAPLWQGHRFPMQTCVTGWAMQTRQPVVMAEITPDSGIPYETYCDTFVKSLATVPILTPEPVGAIAVYWATAHEPTQEQIRLLQALADMTSVAMQNIQMYNELERRVRDRTLALNRLNDQLVQQIQEREQAEAQVRQLSLTDELTELHNRRGFLLLAEQQLKLARRLNTPCCVLFIDLDGLKEINDNFGHGAGDALIIGAAFILKSTFRESDVIARLGGDEFVVLISNLTEAADIIQQRLQARTDEFNATQARHPISMSLGIAIFQANDRRTLDQLVAEADEKMYIAKQHRRSRLSDVS